MYFDQATDYGDMAMLVLYFLLFLFWLFIFAEIVVLRNSTSSVLRYVNFRPISLAFVVFSFLLFFDSLYWTIATAARIGFFDNSNSGILNFFYFGWHVFTVKLLVLIAGVSFLILFRKIHRHLEQRFESLYFTQFLDNSVDAVGVLDKSGNVLFWNKGAEQVYGFKKEEVHHKNIKSFLVPERYRNHLKTIMHKISKTQRPARFRAQRNTKENGEIEVDITMTPFFDQGLFAGYFGVMRPSDSSEIVDNYEYPLASELDEEIIEEPNLTPPFTENNNNRLFNTAVALVIIPILCIVVVIVAAMSSLITQVPMLSLIGLLLTFLFLLTKLIKSGTNSHNISVQLIKSIFEKQESRPKDGKTNS